MHPTQRKLMKRIILFLSLLFCIACPAIAGQDIDLVANVKNSTCKSGISNQGNIDLGVVGVGYFSGNVTPESYQPGGKRVHYHCIRLCITGNWRCAKSVTY